MDCCVGNKHNDDVVVAMVVMLLLIMMLDSLTEVIQRALRTINSKGLEALASQAKIPTHVLWNMQRQQKQQQQQQQQRTFESFDIVLCKLPGYPWWPATFFTNDWIKEFEDCPKVLDAPHPIPSPCNAPTEHQRQQNSRGYQVFWDERNFVYCATKHQCETF